MKKIYIIFIMGIFILMDSRISFAEQNNNESNLVKQTSDKIAVNVGNKICSVTGEKIDEVSKVTYEYNGKIYNLCCAMCIEDFKKNPEKYIKKIEMEKQSQAPATTNTK